MYITKKTITEKKTRITLKELEDEIRTVLATFASSFAAEYFEKEGGVKFNVEKVQLLLEQPHGTEIKRDKTSLISVYAGHDEISHSLVEINKQGPFKGGPTGKLLVEVTGDLENFVLHALIKSFDK